MTTSLKSALPETGVLLFLMVLLGAGCSSDPPVPEERTEQTCEASALCQCVADACEPQRDGGSDAQSDTDPDAGPGTDTSSDAELDSGPDAS
jgi:hypothetical protein